MWIVYCDDIGPVAEHINISESVSIVGDTVYYTTYNGIDKQIPLNSLRGISENNPFYEG